MLCQLMGTQKNRLTVSGDGSFEHPNYMFKLMGKEINAILGEQTIFIWTDVTNPSKGTLTNFPLYKTFDTLTVLLIQNREFYTSACVQYYSPIRLSNRNTKT